jgi:pyrroline-5-carboxylate reductase
VVQSQKPLLWSRRFEALGSPSALSEGESPFSVAPIESVMQSDVVFAAIPSSGIAELASVHRAVRDFGGTLFIAGIDLPIEAVQQLTPAALVVRVVPALLSARDDVPCLVLDRGDGGIRWKTSAEPVLKAIGPVHSVDDEKTFESVMYLTSPFPVVVRRALREAIAKTLARREIEPKWQPVAESILWQALAGMETTAARGGGQDTVEAEVVTPGGVTAAGLREVGRLSQVLVDTLSLMFRHGEQLRGDDGGGHDEKGRQERTEHPLS